MVKKNLFSSKSCTISSPSVSNAAIQLDHPRHPAGPGLPGAASGQGAIVGDHEVTEHVGDGHPRAALDDHQQHQGPEKDAQGGVDAFPDMGKMSIRYLLDIHPDPMRYLLEILWKSYGKKSQNQFVGPKYEPIHKAENS